MKEAILKSLLIWLPILPLGILNGGLREYVLAPKLGTAARPISGILLAIVIFTLVYLFIPRLGRQSIPTYVWMGVLWVALTVLLETLIGIAMGDSHAVILRGYSLSGGNLWVFIVILTGFLPILVARIKHLII